MPGLEDLYREIILDHYRSPRNRGELPVPPARRVEGFNPLCGDEIVVYLDLDDQNVVSDIRAIIKAFKGMMSIHESRLDGDDGSTGGSSAPPEDVKLGDLEALQGVVKFPVRIKC